jgi:hypothetical protein
MYLLWFANAPNFNGVDMYTQLLLSSQDGVEMANTQPKNSYCFVTSVRFNDLFPNEVYKLS